MTKTNTQVGIYLVILALSGLACLWLDIHQDNIKNNRETTQQLWGQY